MKKWIVCLLACIVLLGCQKKTETISDGERFKQEYEALNNAVDQEGNKYSRIEINGEAPIKYVEQEDLEDLFLRGTHVVYLGWPSCGWCRRAVPVLIDVVNQYSGMNLYVYNIQSIREDFTKDPDSTNGKLYKQICAAIELGEASLDEFEHYEDGTLRLPSSAVYFIKNGAVVATHIRTVSSHIDSYEPLTAVQKEELAGIYKECLEMIAQNNNPGCSSCD